MFDFSGFLSQIGKSDIDVMVSEFLRGGLEGGFELTAEDALDILGSGVRRSAEVLPDFRYPIHPPCRVKPRGYRSASTIGDREVNLLDYIPGDLFLVSDSRNVWVENQDSSQRNHVGDCRSGRHFRFQLNPEQGVLSVDMLQEECNAKGTGLGFSSYVHCHGVCLVLSGCPDGIYEPPSGADAETSYGTFEVTGQGWHERTTPCDYVLNKYLLLSSCYRMGPEMKHLIDLSWSEDVRDITAYVGTAIDQGSTPYRQVILDLGKATCDLSHTQKESLVGSFKSWLSRRPPAKPPPREQIDAANLIQIAIAKGAKTNEEDIKMLPALFRVQCTSAASDVERLRELDVRPYIGGSSIGSTYHTVPLDEYDVIERLAVSDYSVTSPFTESNRAHHAIFNQLLRYNFFQSIYLESELIPKINGKDGCFYSEYTRTGIAWQRIRKGSLVYFCCFYSHEPPADEQLYGKWAKRRVPPIFDEVYCSPTFKVNVRDAAFAAVLPYRFFASFVATYAYSTERERATVIKGIMSMIPMASKSSWETSKLAGDQRFITTCGVSQTGDVDAMCRNATETSSDKALSSSCVAYLHMLKCSRLNPPGPDEHVTPLFKMPIRFMSLEKDLPLTMQWHIRGDQHATECLKKLIRSGLEERQHREERVSHLKIQLDYLQKCISEGASQEEFDQVMNSSPLYPSHNHVLFIILSYRAGSTIRDEAGARQHSTGLSIHSMVTNHRMQMPSDPHTRGGAVLYKSIRVHEGMVKMLGKYDSPPCMHKLISRICRGKHIPNDYGIHPKDAKSSNREIAQMGPYMRSPQFFAESMCRVYCDGDESDMMTDHDKAPEYVSIFSEIIEKGGVCSSEDKSFFCGYMQPDLMGLAIHCLSIDIGSTALAGCGAMMIADSSRAVYLPLDADQDIVPAELDPEYVNRVEHKLQGRVKMFKVITCFMQGIRAMAAATYATPVQKGLAMIQAEMSPEIPAVSIMTTSDDAVKGYVPIERPSFNIESTTNEIFYRSNEILNKTQMKDNNRKRMILNAQAEFNNMVTNRNGMLPQQFIHAHLCIQPLLGQSLAADIVAAVSSSRELFFGATA
jgi:hypothetical protein